MNKKPAKKSDWKDVSPLPDKHAFFLFPRTFEADAIASFRHGFIPKDMNDRWFAYWEDDHLYLHRSWTGDCIFKVNFRKEGDQYVVSEVEANRDPEDYTPQQAAEDVEMLSRLLEDLFDTPRV